MVSLWGVSKLLSHGLVTFMCTIWELSLFVIASIWPVLILGCLIQDFCATFFSVPHMVTDHSTMYTVLHINFLQTKWFPLKQCQWWNIALKQVHKWSFGQTKMLMKCFLRFQCVTFLWCYLTLYCIALLCVNYISWQYCNCGTWSWSFGSVCVR